MSIASDFSIIPDALVGEDCDTHGEECFLDGVTERDTSYRPSLPMEINNKVKFGVPEGFTEGSKIIIRVKYITPNDYISKSSDRIGLYEAGFTSFQDYVAFRWAPSVSTKSDGETSSTYSISFEGVIPLCDEFEFHQFCYIGTDGVIEGISEPFQMHQILPHNKETVQSMQTKLEKDMKEAGEMFTSQKSLLEKEISSMEKGKIGLQELCTELEKEKSNLKKEKSKLEKDKSGLQEDNCVMKNQVIELKMQLVDAYKEVDKKDDKIWVLVARNNELEMKVGDLDSDVTELQKNCLHFDSSMVVAEERQVVLLQDNKKLKEIVDEKKADMELMKRELSLCEESKDASERVAAQLSSQLQETNAEVEALGCIKQELEAKIEDLRKILAAKEADDWQVVAENDLPKRIVTSAENVEASNNFNICDSEKIREHSTDKLSDCNSVSDINSPKSNYFASSSTKTDSENSSGNSHSSLNSAPDGMEKPVPEVEDNYIGENMDNACQELKDGLAQGEGNAELKCPHLVDGDMIRSSTLSESMCHSHCSSTQLTEQVYQRMGDIVSKLTSQVDSLKVEVDELKKDSKSKGGSICENDDFKGKNDDFKGENDDFKGENDDFKGVNDDFKGVNDDFKGKNDDFKGENDVFKGKNDDFNGERNEVDYIIGLMNDIDCDSNGPIEELTVDEEVTTPKKYVIVLDPESESHEKSEIGEDKQKESMSLFDKVIRKHSKKESTEGGPKTDCLPSHAQKFDEKVLSEGLQKERMQRRFPNARYFETYMDGTGSPVLPSAPTAPVFLPSRAPRNGNGQAMPPPKGEAIPLPPPPKKRGVSSTVPTPPFGISPPFRVGRPRFLPTPLTPMSTCSAIHAEVKNLLFGDNVQQKSQETEGIKPQDVKERPEHVHTDETHFKQSSNSIQTGQKQWEYSSSSIQTGQNQSDNSSNSLQNNEKNRNIVKSDHNNENNTNTGASSVKDQTNHSASVGEIKQPTKHQMGPARRSNPQPIDYDSGPLHCPMCSLTFPPPALAILEEHINSHLEFVCPVCSRAFQRSNKDGFEVHVYSHFPNDGADTGPWDPKQPYKLLEID